MCAPESPRLPLGFTKPLLRVLSSPQHRQDPLVPLHLCTRTQAKQRGVRSPQANDGCPGKPEQARGRTPAERQKATTAPNRLERGGRSPQVEPFGLAPRPLDHLERQPPPSGLSHQQVRDHRTVAHDLSLQLREAPALEDDGAAPLPREPNRQLQHRSSPGRIGDPDRWPRARAPVDISQLSNPSVTTRSDLALEAAALEPHRPGAAGDPHVDEHRGSKPAAALDRVDGAHELVGGPTPPGVARHEQGDRHGCTDRMALAPPTANGRDAERPPSRELLRGSGLSPRRRGPRDRPRPRRSPGCPERRSRRARPASVPGTRAGCRAGGRSGSSHRPRPHRCGA